MTDDTEVKPLTAEMARCYVRCTVPDRGAGEALAAIAEGRHIVIDTAKLGRLLSALEWISGACDVPDRCQCGRPTGVLAVRSHALRALNAAQQEGSRYE